MRPSPPETHRWWVPLLLLFSLLPEGLSIRLSGRTPNIFLFDVVVVGIAGYLAVKVLFGSLTFDFRDGWLLGLSVAFFFAQLLSVLFNFVVGEGDLFRGVYAIKVFSFGVLSYLALTLLLKSRHDLLGATYSLVVWGGVVGLLLAFNFFTDWSGTMGSEANYVAKDEVAISMGRSNYLAAMLLPILPIGVAVIFSRTGLSRLLLTLPVALVALGLLITTSKGAFVSLFVGSLCAIPVMVKSGIRVKHLVLFAILLVVFIYLVPEDLVVFNINMASYRIDNPDFGRVDLWKTAWDTFLDHPILGVGPGSIYMAYDHQLAINETVDAHNYVLHTLAETGVVGALPFFLMVVALLKRTYRVCKTKTLSRELHLLPVGLFTGLMCTLIHGLVEPTFQGQQYATVFWMCAALVFMVGQEQEKSQGHHGAQVLVPQAA